MKLTFLIPPSYNHERPAERSAGCTRMVYPMPNIYELTVAGMLRDDYGYDVVYRDCVFEKVTISEFKNFISGDDSDVYMIWTVNLSIESDIMAISDIRLLRGNVPIVLMGPGATYYVSKCIVDNWVYVVRGEPELTVVELLEALRYNRPLSRVQGLSYMDLAGCVINNHARPLMTDLDALAFPARDLVADHKFHNPKLKTGPYTTMFTSRNCPFQCIYCVPSSLSFAREIEYSKNHSGHKPPIGFRSVGSIEREIVEIVSQGYRAIGFMDDNFIWNEQRTKDICNVLKRHNLVWGCEARVDSITESIAQMLGESGCKYVDLGVESFNEEILKYIKKGISLDDIYNAVRLLKKYKVPVKLNILIGSCPLETRETVLHTLEEAKKLDVDQVMFNIVSPFPGTKYYELCKANGWIRGGEYRPTDVQRESILELPKISAKEMERLLFRNNISFFLRPKFILKQLRRFSSLSEFKSSLIALKIKLFG